MNRIGKWHVALIFVSLLVLFPWINIFSLTTYLKLRHNLSIQGLWIPDYLRFGHFQIRHCSLQLEDRFRVVKGEVNVELRPFFPVFWNRVRVVGTNLEVELLDPKLSRGHQPRFPVRRVDCDLELKAGQALIVRQFEIDSDELKFQLKGRELS